MSPEDMLEKLESKLDRIDSRLNAMDVTLAKQAGSLDEHIRRTEALESWVESIQEELEPIKSHVSAWAGAGKLVVVLGVLAGIVFGAWKLFG